MNFNEVWCVSACKKKGIRGEWDDMERRERIREREDEQQKKSMCFIKCILFLFMYGEVCFRPQANSKHVFLWAFYFKE